MSDDNRKTDNARPNDSARPPQQTDNTRKPDPNELSDRDAESVAGGVANIKFND